MKTRDLVIQRIPEIPALPAAAARVLHLVQDPDIGIGAIMEAIEYDPVLTTEVLRLANTAYFAGPRTIGTLRDAGLLFGTDRILQLVLATSVFPIARQPLLGYDLPAGQLIRHSMAVAIGSEQMATLCGRPAPDHTFTAGLLSDIGKIVLGSSWRSMRNLFFNSPAAKGFPLRWRNDRCSESIMPKSAPSA